MLTWAVIWIVCGILAYGMIKNDLKNELPTKRYLKYYNYIDEMLSVICGLAGPIGLIGTLVFIVRFNSKIGFCYQIPKELRA